MSRYTSLNKWLRYHLFVLSEMFCFPHHIIISKLAEFHYHCSITLMLSRILQALLIHSSLLKSCFGTSVIVSQLTVTSLLQSTIK